MAHDISIESAVAVIHAKVLFDKGHPSDLIGAYIQDRFPSLTPTDIEHVLTNAEKMEFLVAKQKDAK